MGRRCVKRQIKRGVRHPGGSRKEAQIMGPYPTWAGWKSTLFNSIPETKDLSSNDLAELEEFYNRRRQIQKSRLKGILDLSPIEEFTRAIKEKDESFFCRCQEQISFITNRTQSQNGSTDKIRIR